MATSRGELEEPLGYEIIIFEKAAKEIVEIVKWYDTQGDGLGERFLVQLRAAIKKLRTHPLAFGFSFKDVRKAQLNTFPYLIFYKVKGDRFTYTV